jgi:acetolactate synthase-1/2/3 large subunit
MKYSDYFIDSLVEQGYTHCFFVGGGNVMHLLESARTRLECIAVVHEVSAGIAAEYFNVANRESNKRAFAMVTAGPGITNMITAMGGAWLESRELLVVGGQARTDFMTDFGVRQIGHQQIDGRSIVEPISKVSLTIKEPISKKQISDLCSISSSGRKGPVFLEICLDVTAMEVTCEKLENKDVISGLKDSFEDLVVAKEESRVLKSLIESCERPLILVGGGLKYSFFKQQLSHIRDLGIPVATTWNAADYLDADDPLYAGRPNTYGMRWANAVIQQADLVISLGARLGLQQTGFSWENFVPVGRIVRIDLDENELQLQHPKSQLTIKVDAAVGLEKTLSLFEERTTNEFVEWREYIGLIKSKLPTIDSSTYQFPEYVNPFQLVDELATLLTSQDYVIPCSSGGSYTSMMQVFSQKQGQLLTNNKGLASMGYGLAGSIGSALANQTGRTVLVEGDGGFAQNLQELGTVKVRNLNLKMFIFSNLGYASIRVSQKAYFNGSYIGCDRETGVGLPDWEKLFDAYEIPVVRIGANLLSNEKALQMLSSVGPAAFVVDIHPDQSFLPKVTSKIFSDGNMRSNPIHLMDPQLDEETSNLVFKYLPTELKS